MSFVLSLYSTRAFKEVLLPAIDNADFSLVLQSALFGLTQDVEISMEIIDGSWKIRSKDDYSFIYADTKAPYSEAYLKDGDVLSGNIAYGDPISIIVKETTTSFGVFQKFSLTGVNEISIGSNPNNLFCYNSLNLISGSHARIANRGGQFIIEDLGQNGIFLNSKRVVSAAQLSFGDCIDIFGLKIVFLGDFIAVNSYVENLRIIPGVLMEYNPVYPPRPTGKYTGTVYKSVFHRTPRNMPKIESEPVEIEAPPTPRELNEKPAFMAIGPSLTMALPMAMGCMITAYASKMRGGGSSAFMYTGLITAIGSALIGTIWAILNMRHAKKVNREDELKRFEAYSQYLIGCATDIKAKYENNTRGMRGLYQPAERLVTYDANSLELWNKNARHEDFLAQRLGIGSIPFQVTVNVPKERFTMINDSLADRPRMIKESYKMLQDVPVCVDLDKHRLIGLIGGDKRRGCYSVMHALVTQIAAGNCYTDVKLGFIYDEMLDDSGSQWEFAKWLPHVWSEDKKTRYVAGNKTEASDVFYEITKVLRQRAEEERSYSSKKTTPKPYYILFIENPEYLEGELIAKYITNPDANYGITTILMAQGYEDLPNVCEYIIENTAQFAGMYGVADGLEDRVAIKYDVISQIQLENFSRTLSCIEVSEIETGGEIPGVLTFFDMYGAKKLEDFNVIERWKKNRTYDSLRALVGQKAGGADCYLDVHEKYHGPHGLVAGTTGSGKSETLQTYMLSLALNYSPDDVGFFVIDYKGGGMANLFDGLPHMIGQISNLSGNQVHRAMVSIKSENVRRQRIFSEHGVNNINLYTRLYKNNEASIPIPHMFIIIDEFAELKREEPDFMRELISVAQVGRSLGVHLILATQKPAGTVDDNIWSNSKFRLCLRVQDRQDSNDMLHRPDAAYITQAGRCYMQVGNDELFELFQSAWSGAVYDENAGSVQTNIARMLSDNGKAALVGSHAQIKLKDTLKNNWVKSLLEVLTAASAKTGIDIGSSIYDSTLLAKLTEEFFVQADIRKVEYPESDYNMHRVQDLIYVYAGILNKDEDNDAETEMSRRVISQAMYEGRKLPEMKEKTQLDAIVEYLGRVAKSNGYIHNLKLWLPVLPETLYLESLNGYSKNAFDGNVWPENPKAFTLDTMIGLYDDPVNQAQSPISLDIAVNGNHAIIGTVVSGKSTFLMTYIYSLTNRYTPDAVNLYILDYSSKMLGAFDKLAHVGGVIFENEDEKVSKFFTMLEQMLAERKKMFEGGSYSQYIRANGLKVPAIVVVIDNMASFRNKTNSAYDDFMLNILKEGASYGIFFIVTAAGFGMNEIPNRMADNFRTVMCLEMNDKYAYTDALRTMHIDVLPEENVKGRGLAKVRDSILEYQTALCVEAEDDYKRGEKIRAHCERMNAAWTGKRAKAIPEIPENPVWNEFKELDDVVSMTGESRYLPIGYDQKLATVCGVDLSKTYRYIISGKARTGKTNVLRNMISAAGMMGGRIVIVDFDGELRQIAEMNDAKYLASSQDIYSYFESVMDELRTRSDRKKELLAMGYSDIQMFEKMQEFDKLFIFVGNLTAFVNAVHKPDPGVGNISDFMTAMIEKATMCNIYWFSCFNQDDIAAVAGLGVYTQYIKEKSGMHLGGNTNVQKILPLDYIPFNEQAKPLKPGLAYMPVVEADDTKLAVLPLYVME